MKLSHFIDCKVPKNLWTYLNKCIFRGRYSVFWNRTTSFSKWRPKKVKLHLDLRRLNSLSFGWKSRGDATHTYICRMGCWQWFAEPFDPRTNLDIFFYFTNSISVEEPCGTRVSVQNLLLVVQGDFLRSDETG